MEIKLAESKADLEQIRILFQEYFTWLKHEQGLDISYQGIQQELASLPGMYAPPDGALLLAWSEGAPAGRPVGCVALRRIDEHTCEMKRMYLCFEYRGKGIGKALGRRVIQEARDKGYTCMRLDTGDTMTSAINLYKSLGFQLSEAYYEVPPDIRQRAVFMEMQLNPE